MIAAGSAQAAAAAAVGGLIAAQDAMFASWPEPAVGTPVPVEDIAGVPAYWLVPLETGEHVIGAVRVGAEGRIMTIGITCRSPERIADCPRVVTGLSQAEAAAKAAVDAAPTAGETLAAPRFVHDGPPGREAWLIDIRRDSESSRWLFVTPGGSYARPAGIEWGVDAGRE